MPQEFYGLVRSTHEFQPFGFVHTQESDKCLNLGERFVQMLLEVAFLTPSFRSIARLAFASSIVRMVGRMFPGCVWGTLVYQECLIE